MNEYWNLFLATGMPEAWVMSRKMGDRPAGGEQLWPLAAYGDPVRPCGHWPPLHRRPSCT